MEVADQDEQLFPHAPAECLLCMLFPGIHPCSDDLATLKVHGRTPAAVHTSFLFHVFRWVSLQLTAEPQMVSASRDSADAERRR